MLIGQRGEILAGCIPLFEVNRNTLNFTRQNGLNTVERTNMTRHQTTRGKNYTAADGDKNAVAFCVEY